MSERRKYFASVATEPEHGGEILMGALLDGRGAKISGTANDGRSIVKVELRDGETVEDIVNFAQVVLNTNQRLRRQS